MYYFVLYSVFKTFDVAFYLDSFALILKLPSCMYNMTFVLGETVSVTIDSEFDLFCNA